MASRPHRPPIDILIAQNESLDVDLTRKALFEYETVNGIHFVPDGAAALDFLFGRGVYRERRDQPPPRIFLLDLKLPGLPGLEVLRQIKADPRTRKIPVAVLTSSTEACDLAACYDLGANSYVVKPAGLEKYIQMVRRLISYWLLINRHAEAGQP